MKTSPSVFYLNKSAIQLLLTVIITFTFPACGQQTTSFDGYKTTFVSGMKDALTDSHVARAVYAVADKDSLLLEENFTSVGIPATANTPFLIGSVTKVFTAVAIMQLSEQGKIDLDRPVTDYVPDFAIHQRFPNSEPITIRQVLTHHAGLPSDIYLHKFSSNPHDLNEVLPYLNSQYTCYPVGKLWSYSNLGYALLGIVAERVSGMKYEDYISQKILKPLGMHHSGFYNSFGEQKNLSVAYNNDGKPTTEYPILDKPAGAIYSTLNDMIVFCRSFIDGKGQLLKKETIERMFELQNRDNLLDLDHRSAICFNFKNKAYSIGRTFEHGGATMFHRAQIYIAPDAGLVAVMLSDSPNGKDNAWKLNEEFMVKYCEEKGIKPNLKLNPEKKMKFTAIKTKDLATYSGNYAMPGMICHFEWKHNYLNPTIQGSSFYLVPSDENSFVPAKRVLGIMFKSNKMHFLLEEIDKQKLFIQAMAWGELSVIGTKTETKPIPEIWKKRVGNYVVTNTSEGDVASLTNVKIAEEQGFIVLKYGFNPEMTFGQEATVALDLKNDKEAFVLGLGRGGGESVVFDNKGSFEYFGLKFSKK